ncbi:MAG TPA: ABC transporter ATP-binding protein [Chthoniobacterales bacterium]
MSLTQSPPVPVLHLQDLTVKRGPAEILRGISWQIEQGENWVILGPNGSGKTSLLSALTGYLTPSSGTVDVLGRRFGETDWRELRKSVGIVSSSVRQRLPDDEEALITVVSGRQAMIDYWGKVTRAERAEAFEILERLECRYLAKRPWLVLSQGERQRVLIARALMAHPRLLILDEPCSGLDPIAREHFLVRMESLAQNKDGPTLILVTHHVEEITPSFDNALLLRDGRALVAGPVRKLLNSRWLSETFGHPVRVTHRSGRYALATS